MLGCSQNKSRSWVGAGQTAGNRFKNSNSALTVRGNLFLTIQHKRLLPSKWSKTGSSKSGCFVNCKAAVGSSADREGMASRPHTVRSNVTI